MDEKYYYVGRDIPEAMLAKDRSSGFPPICLHRLVEPMTLEQAQAAQAAFNAHLISIDEDLEEHKVQIFCVSPLPAPPKD